jgi:hypothetical protein
MLFLLNRNDRRALYKKEPDCHSSAAILLAYCLHISADTLTAGAPESQLLYLLTAP